MCGGHEGDEVKFIALFFLVVPSMSFADSTTVFGGFGLGIGSQTLSTPGNSASTFTTQGYFLEGGLLFKFGGQMSAEYGASNSINTLSSETYMETGTLSYYSAKLGLNFTRLGFGGGYRHIDVNLRSISTDGSGYLESRYGGWNPFGYINCHFDVNKKIRTAVEGQYVMGKLKSENPILPQVDYSEMSISLRLYVLID